MPNQSTAILAHLRTHGSITPLDALNHYGCFRLAARVNELRRDGYPIRTDLVKRDGKMWAEYSIEEPTQAGLW